MTNAVLVIYYDGHVVHKEETAPWYTEKYIADVIEILAIWDTKIQEFKKLGHYIIEINYGLKQLWYVKYDRFLWFDLTGIGEKKFD